MDVPGVSDGLDLEKRLSAALAARMELLRAGDSEALRLFNGFYEGCPELVADLYGRTLLLSGHARPAEQLRPLLEAAQEILLQRLPEVDCVVHKYRQAKQAELRRGLVAYGGLPCQQVNEHGVKYAIDLRLNQDASFYLDTRGLRAWLLEHAKNWRVLNTFAYTGSLGVAALAGGAIQVVQVDRSRKFLALAQRSARINRLDLGKMQLRVDDFFSQVAALKRQGALFDCALLDPPFFSATNKGSLDLLADSARLVNKVRPLVQDGGYLVVVNNALFLSGADYLKTLEGLCADGYLRIETLIPAPEDVTGYLETRLTSPPVDPAPFNHPTKMAVLRVRRK
ncbi:MAG: class I SAM-dependent methyltransferase [Chloroflexota bacterium]